MKLFFGTCFYILLLIVTKKVPNIFLKCIFFVYFSRIFPIFSIYCLWSQQPFTNISTLLFTLIKCEKKIQKKNVKNVIFLFQHSILFFENGQK